MNRLLDGIDQRRAAVRLGTPPTIQARVPPGAAWSGLGPRVKRAVSEKVAAAHLAARCVAVGRTRCAGDREPARLADGRRGDARAGARPARVRRSGPQRGLHGRGTARDGRLVARSRGDPPLVRRPCRRPRLHVLDSTHPDAILAVEDVGRPRQDGLHRLLQVRRHDRDALALPLLRGASAKPEQFVVVTDPGSPLEQIAQGRRAAARRS